MIKYIGLDAHSSTGTFNVTDARGREIDNTTMESNGRLLVKYVRGIEGVKKLTFEECELSNWLYELLRPEVDELIVCNPVANKDYKKVKTDKMDARKLSNLLRGGFLIFNVQRLGIILLMWVNFRLIFPRSKKLHFYYFCISILTNFKDNLLSSYSERHK